MNFHVFFRPGPGRFLKQAILYNFVQSIQPPADIPKLLHLPITHVSTVCKSCRTTEKGLLGYGEVNGCTSLF